MFNAFIGQVSIIAGTYAPKGWLLCDGSTLDINNYQSLFSVIGTIYGGDGRRTFKIPDLRGCIPNRRGPTFQQGMKGGQAQTRLSYNNLPSHTHSLLALSIDASESTPTDQLLSIAQSRYDTSLYHTYGPSQATTLSQQSIQDMGGNEPINTMPSFLTLNFIICLNGYYPSRQ